MATLVHEIDPKVAVCDVVAVDLEGRERRGDARSLDSETFSLLQVVIDLPPDQIREFRFQRRERDRVGILGIALEPRLDDSP